MRTSAPDRPDTNRVVWRFEVTADAHADDLSVDARFGPGSDDLRVADGASPFVRDLEYEDGTQWRRAQPSGRAWALPCLARGCHVRYRFALKRAAMALRDVDTAVAAGDLIVAPPSTWLVRPMEGSSGRFRVRVRSAAPARFAAGTRPAPDGAPDAFEASTETLDGSAFAVFGAFHPASVQNASSRVELAIAPQGLALADADVVSWVRTAVDAIAAYLGHFPAPRTLLVVVPGGGGPTRGETLGDGGPAVLLRVGEHVTADTTQDDWVVTHELLHVSLPSLSPAHAWLDEGLATYVEPIVRARAGIISPEKVWRDLVEGLPQGLPQTGDEGLERTRTWGRTYWGGALFCLMADVTLRERTHNAQSLDEVLRAVVRTGADVEEHWDMQRWLEQGDRATGTDVLRTLYRNLALAPGTVDLGSLWSRLGVRVAGGAVTLDNGAPLAAIRRAIGGER